MNFQNQRSPGLIAWLRSDRYLCKRFNIAYDRFINQIQHVSKQENQSKPDSLHVLARIREHLPLSAQILRIIGDLYNAPWICIPNIQNHTLYSVHAFANVFMFLNIPQRERHILRNGFVTHDHLMECNYRRTVYFQNELLWHKLSYLKNRDFLLDLYSIIGVVWHEGKQMWTNAYNSFLTIACYM